MRDLFPLSNMAFRPGSGPFPKDLDKVTSGPKSLLNQSSRVAFIVSARKKSKSWGEEGAVPRPEFTILILLYTYQRQFPPYSGIFGEILEC